VRGALKKAGYTGGGEGLSCRREPNIPSTLLFRKPGGLCVCVLGGGGSYASEQKVHSRNFKNAACTCRWY